MWFPNNMQTSRDTVEWKRILRWVAFGAAFGAGSALLSQVCMCAVPAWPGGIIGGLIAGEPLITDHGADLKWLVPVNMVFYTLVGGWLGDYLNQRKRQARNEPRCTECDYLLVGNTSGRCPECGTRASRKCKTKLAALRSSNSDQPSDGAERDETKGRGIGRDDLDSGLG